MTSTRQHSGERVTEAAETAGLAALAAAAPGSYAGLRRLRAFVDAPAGALEVREKALITAAAAAARGQERVLADWLATARDAGAPAEHAWGTARVLLLSRGEAACERFATAILACYGEPARDHGPLSDFDHDAALEELRAYFGELPAQLDLLARSAPQAFEGFVRVTNAAKRDNPLPMPLVELVLCAVNAAELASPFVAIHADLARKAGVTEAQLFEAIVATMPVAGAAGLAAGAVGIFQRSSAGGTA